jgi:hypothetical protein
VDEDALARVERTVLEDHLPGGAGDDRQRRRLQEAHLRRHPGE